MSERIGFVGMGTMGSGMAANLAAAGHQVLVWNRTRAKAEAVQGVEVADDLRQVSAECDVVMICVADTPDVRRVLTGDRGLLEGLRSGSLVVDHSTISPAVTRELADLVAGDGAAWLDAPVSGGSEGAQRGTLSVMVGGDAEQLSRARPYIEAFAATITHVGPVGAGQTAKLVNQILVVVTQLGVSEALLLAEAAGLDLSSTLAAVEGGAGGSWMLSNRGPQMIGRDWRPGFTIDLQQKDLRLVLETAERLQIPLPGTALVHQMYGSLQRRGLGGEGNHGLVKALEAMSELEVGVEEQPGS
ncbi:MAG: NAD-binding protein [Propionibacteriales bacterium]|nr:NAD-binding protein [Propionibacteriales bacterium]